MLAADVPVQHVHAHAASNRVSYAIVRLLNRTRASYGLSRLRVSRRLFRAAGAHSRDLAVHATFSHDSSDGTPFGTRMRRVTSARLIGETIMQMTGQATARRTVQGWMASPPHRQEILTSGYHRVGVGTARRGAWLVVTADFSS